MKKFNKSKNRFIKYSKTELESYVRDAGSCVKKVESEEIIRYSPTNMVNLQKSILDELGRKIGRYESKLEGVVLDFRDTKVHGNQSEIRQDSAYSSIKVQTNFYVFKPQKDAIVTGVIKFINRLAMETVFSVVIYRVFNVRVTVRGKVKQEVEKDQEVEIRLKEFHFDNVIPHVEGEIVKLKISGDKAFDSGVSVTSEPPEDLSAIVKHERFTSDDDDTESNSSMQTKLNTKNNSKRKLEYDEETPSTSSKKVKIEPRSDSEPTPVKVKKEKITDDDESNEAADFDLEELLGLSKKNKKKKKKSRKSLNFDDELNKLLDSV